MAKQVKKISTPVGDFARTTATNYTHAVVRTSVRAKRAYDAAQAGERPFRHGVNGRWIKDRGYAVTWHGSEAAARKAAAEKYVWDYETTLVGIFEVASA